MHLARFHPVFLIVASLLASSAHVEPPTDVTLHCHNLDNILKWNYSQLWPEIRFRVDYLSLSSPPKTIWVDSPLLQANLSSLSDPNEVISLTVTAVNGQNESESAPPDGITFSYDINSPARQKCLLDFPSVNVTAHEDGHVLFHFIHPWILSKLSTTPMEETSQDSELPEFMYYVDVKNQHTPEEFTCLTKLCEGKVAVNPEQKEYCLNFEGEMNLMSFQASQDYCTLPVPEMTNNHKNIVNIAISVVIVAFLAIVFVIFMVFKKKTRASSSIPKSTIFSGQRKNCTLGVDEDPVLPVVVDSGSPTPLISPTDESMKSSIDPSLCLPIEVVTEDEGICDFGQAGNGDLPGYMKGSGLEDTDTQPWSGTSCGYETRPVIVELAPDELAEGYRS